MKVNIIIEKDQYGYYAFCPELKGCHTQGDSLEEVLENIKEAIELYLETLSPHEREYCLSKEILTTSMEVKVAYLPVDLPLTDSLFRYRTQGHRGRLQCLLPVNGRR